MAKALKYDSMSMAHRRTKEIIENGKSNGRKYKEILAFSLSAVGMMYRKCTNDDINYLKSSGIKGFVDLRFLQSLHKDNTYQAYFESRGKVIFSHSNPYYVHGRRIERSKFN